MIKYEVLALLKLQKKEIEYKIEKLQLEESNEIVEALLLIEEEKLKGIKELILNVLKEEE